MWVESEVDSDRDGARDLIRVRISRPREAQERGYKVPVVYEHSPYRGDTGNPANHDVDFDTLPQERGARASASARRGAAVRRGKRTGRKAHRASAGPRPTCPARSTTTTCRAATRSCSARASAPSTRTAARTSAPTPRRSAPRPRSTGSTAAPAASTTPATPVTRRLDHGRRRHGRHVLQRHAAQPGRDDRRRGAEDDHPRLGDLLLVRLLPRQRPRGRAALQHARRRRERLPRRGHRRARRLHRRPADGGPERRAAASCTTTCSRTRTA